MADKQVAGMVKSMMGKTEKMTPLKSLKIKAKFQKLKRAARRPTMAKAKLMLKDNSAQGRPLTGKQKGLFGAIAGGTSKRTVRPTKPAPRKAHRGQFNTTSTKQTGFGSKSVGTKPVTKITPYGKMRRAANPSTSDAPFKPFKQPSGSMKPIVPVKRKAHRGQFNTTAPKQQGWPSGSAGLRGMKVPGAQVASLKQMLKRGMQGKRK